ncbi:hypothetical protein [Streptomyces globisporus]|uniref:hypothetical protein n=1 Tax=Streptomyces globisporus TaxID=1908 RepID=UPI0004C5BACE|nr:hypothetical protein [Streptomyces globisporus]
MRLRRHLAQLVVYSDDFRDRDGVRLVLWVERAPQDEERWMRICAGVRIVLVRPAGRRGPRLRLK